MNKIDKYNRWFKSEKRRHLSSFSQLRQFFKPGFHIIAGIAGIARIAEKCVQRFQRLYGNQILFLVAIQAIAAIRIAGIEPGSISAIVATEIHTKNLMEITFSDPSDREVNVNSVLTHHVSGTNLASNQSCAYNIPECD